MTWIGFIWHLLVLGAVTATWPVLGEQLNVIPNPQRVTLGSGAFQIDASTTVGYSHLSAFKPTSAFIEDLKRLTGLTLRITQNTNPDILFAIERTSNTTQPPTVGAQLPRPEDEAYRIRVVDHGIRITATTPTGLFYGGKTLVQLVPESGNAATPRVRAMDIEDYPRFRWRGMHLDVCRHFMPIEFVKRYIDLLALYKFNVFHWHLTEDQGWRIEIKKHPRLTSVSAWRDENGARYGGFYTQDEIRDVVAYARERHILVLPEIEMPGHALAALASYPELSCTGGPFEVATTWGVFDDVYCAGNDETFEFLTEILQEVLTLFPSGYIHIGGDECPKKRWKACARCQARIKKENLHDEDELQAYFVRRIAEFLKSRNRVLIGWDEITEGGLEKDAVVMSWRGIGPGIRAALQGHDVVMSPTSHCYFDYRQLEGDEEPGARWAPVLSLADVFRFDPALGIPKETLPHILGVQGNVWTETMETPERVEYMALPRMCALAEVGWSSEVRKSWSQFKRRMNTHRARLDRLGVNYCPTFTNDNPATKDGATGGDSTK